MTQSEPVPVDASSVPGLVKAPAQKQKEVELAGLVGAKEGTGANKPVDLVKAMTAPEISTLDVRNDGNVSILNNSDARSENFYSVDGFRRSLRANNSQVNGVDAADENLLSKAMLRAAKRNLDGPLGNKTVATECGMPQLPFIPQLQMNGNPNPSSSISFVGMPSDLCAENLQRVGFKQGESCISSVNVSINALKRIEIDRRKLQLTQKGKTNIGIATQEEDSDDDVAESTGNLLSQLIQEVSEVDFDEEDLDTRICEFKVCPRKSKSKKDKRKKLKF